MLCSIFEIEFLIYIFFCLLNQACFVKIKNFTPRIIFDKIKKFNMTNVK